MRLESKHIATAFLAKTAYNGARTHTDGHSVYLHNNLIAWHATYPDGAVAVYAALAGWPTVTTRERLNMLARMLGIPGRFYQIAGRQYFGGREIRADEVVTLHRAPAPVLESV